MIALVLARYAPAAVAGLGAIRLHLEEFSPPQELVAHQGANQSEYALPLETEFTLHLQPRKANADRLNFIEAPGKARIPTLSPAQVLTTLSEREIVAGIESVSAWLRHLVIRTPDLEIAIGDGARAAALQRLADLAGSLQNPSLARQLEQAARRLSVRVNSPKRTGVGTRIQIPHALGKLSRGSGSPWLDEQAMRLARQEAEIEKLTGKVASALPRFGWRHLRLSAEELKASDAYHSTTMEGYRITRDVSDAIVRGEPLLDGPQDAETLRAAMAIRGYSLAFNEVLARAQRKASVGTDLILDLYESLFRPSVDAGVTDPAALSGWRTSSVGLRGWRHVPPNPKKIPDLIGGLERFAAREDLAPVARALLVHLEFVTIHPFMDGNGWLGRLLMNHVLLSAGPPWVTIRSDERIPFFKSIELAQVDDNSTPFIQFVWHLVAQSASELRKKHSGTRRNQLSAKSRT